MSGKERANDKHPQDISQCYRTLFCLLLLLLLMLMLLMLLVLLVLLVPFFS